MSEKKLHSLFIVFFVMISIFLTLGRVGTAFNSFALLTPDLGAYVSLAVAQDHPQFFIHDPFLSNEKNTNSNDMIYIPLIRALKPIFGNYGAVCVFLLPIFIFIHLLGYYVLGVSIFKNPWAGLVISLLISAPINTYYDYWGLILDAVPRFLYQGMIPFLLALSIVRGNNPKWWPVIMAGLGALNYIHPLDTPAWALAFTFGLWLSASEVEFWYKVRMMALAIIVLAVILTPFILNYVGSTVKTTSEVVNYSQTLAILQARFSTMSTISLPAILSNFFINPQGVVFDLIWYSVCMLALVGVIYGLVSYKISKEPAFILQITGWILAGCRREGYFEEKLQFRSPRAQVSSGFR